MGNWLKIRSELKIKIKIKNETKHSFKKQITSLIILLDTNKYMVHIRQKIAFYSQVFKTFQFNSKHLKMW